MARHIGIYTEEAIKTALGGAERPLSCCSRPSGSRTSPAWTRG